MSEQKPSVGRIVHYVMPESGAHRPAIIVRCDDPERPDGLVNLQVFIDSLNDGASHQSVGTLWATSIHHDQQETRQGTWHFPEVIGPTIAQGGINALEKKVDILEMEIHSIRAEVAAVSATIEEHKKIMTALEQRYEEVLKILEEMRKPATHPPTRKR